MIRGDSEALCPSTEHLSSHLHLRDKTGVSLQFFLSFSDNLLARTELLGDSFSAVLLALQQPILK